MKSSKSIYFFPRGLKTRFNLPFSIVEVCVSFLFFFFFSSDFAVFVWFCLLIKSIKSFPALSAKPPSLVSMQLKPGSTAWLLSKGHRRCPGVLLCFQCSVIYSLRFVWTFNHKSRCLSVVWQRENLQRKIHFITYDLYPPEEQQSEIPMKISCWEVGELHSGVLCSLYTSLQYFLNSDFSYLPSCVF